METPYVPYRRPAAPNADDLRSRIPGWGVDLDPADRPSFPREQPGLPSGAHWEFPERQQETWPRERSIEHAFVTPVFGTSCPPKGLSGVIRKLAYRRYSEARAAHWLLLLGADRVDALEHHLRSFVSLRPDNPITQTGIRSELSHKGMSSRFGQKPRRVDLAHQPLDPIIVGAPWVIGGLYGVRLARTAAKAIRARR